MTPEIKSALDAVLDRPGGLSDAQVAQIEPYLDRNNRSDVAITAVINQGRVRIASTLVGEGAVSNAIGFPAGSVFMRALRLAAEADLPDDSAEEQAIQKAVVEEVWRHLQNGTLDLGLPTVQTKMGAIAELYDLTPEQVEAVKALAVVSDPVSMGAVSWALNEAMEIHQE